VFRFPHYQQLDSSDCGAASLRMIAKYYGKTYSGRTLRELSYTGRLGVSLLGLSKAAESIGLRSQGVRIDFKQLVEEVNLPCIVHWRQNHFVVVYKVSRTSSLFGKTNTKIHVSDPARELLTYSEKEFKESWASVTKDGECQGFCLLLETTPEFYQHDDLERDKMSLLYFLGYLMPYRRFYLQIILSMTFGFIINIVTPFLSQTSVDYGIGNSDIGFIYMVMVAQLVIMISETLVGFIRSWILLHITTRVSVSVLSGFLLKLMHLPISFFDSRIIGDIIQRIGDNNRIQSFLTSVILNSFFITINIIVFSIILAFYNVKIFGILMVGATLYICWILLFMKKRRMLDYKRFERASENQTVMVEMLNGMQEIKLNNYEHQKRWEWEQLQAKVFKINAKGLAIGQFQSVGSIFINNTTSILISILSVTAVVEGKMTLGMMVAVQYIIGQVKGPLSQMLGFITSAQDARISLERLCEIHQKEDEEKFDENRMNILPTSKSIQITNLSFHYEGPHTDPVLKDLNLEIPEGKVTALVGTSGSGKTTLIKLLLGMYEPTRGMISVDNINLQNFWRSVWREKCGMVMQDGYIFADTITENIVVGDQNPDKERIIKSVKIANLHEFINSLPMGFNTKIGDGGQGLSQGQRQRILLARSVYKEPDYLFFDEATNALDSENERIIMNNLNTFFTNRTVIIVAHRLSTVRNADQIVVLVGGKIAELGTHSELVAKNGQYFNLIKNQLELETKI
jgi:ATP-binding cassette, subfamily B, bacterial